MLEALERQNGPDAINAIEPLPLHDGSLGIGTNHQRSAIYLFGAILLSTIAVAFYFRAVRPNPLPGTGNAVTAYLVLSLFISLGLFSLLLYIKSPTADTVLVVDRLGGYAAWRSGLTLFPRQLTLTWSEHRLHFAFESTRRSNVDLHFVRVFRAPLHGGRKRLLFSTRVDDAAREYWLRYAGALPAIILTGEGAV